MTRILIVGATSLIAEHTARLWGNPGVEFVLLAKDPKKLSAVAQDLAVRTGAKTEEIILDFLSPREISATVARIFKEPVDVALIAQGVLTRQPEAKDPRVVFDSVAINASSPAMFAESIANCFEAQGYGSLGIIGSVAGERGRGARYVYGASKAFLEKYVEGLNNRFFGTKVKFSIIKPGPVATPMISADTAQASFTAKPETVARLIVRGMKKGKAKIYTPRIWRILSFIIRAMPTFLFDRIKL